MSESSFGENVAGCVLFGGLLTAGWVVVKWPWHAFAIAVSVAGLIWVWVLWIRYLDRCHEERRPTPPYLVDDLTPVTVHARRTRMPTATMKTRPRHVLRGRRIRHG